MSAEAMNVRAAEERDVEELARVWFELARRSRAHCATGTYATPALENFRDRLQAALPNVGVIGPPGSPLGFYMLKEAELYQLFVSAQARGTGVAAALLADAEARLAARGVETAWLACAIGNERAARFYEKCGWHRVGTMVNEAETSDGAFLLDVWRYEKSVAR
jgi:ribosomal protein S18 acetylase RimI-like enzyme